MSKKYIFFFIFVFILQLIARLIFDSPIQVWEDHDIALNLINEGEFYYESDGARNYTFQFPVYTTCLAIIYSMFGINVFAIIIFNIFIHVLSGILFHYLFKLLLDYLNPSISETNKEKIIFVSLLFYLFHPVLIIYSFYHVHPLALNILSLFSGLYFSLRFASNPTNRNLIFVGVVIGLAMMDRATVLLTLIPAGIILLQKFNFWIILKKMSIVVLIISVIISPWLIRNYLKDGIIGFESSAAKNIWKGVIYNSDGSNYLLNGENYYSALTTEEKLSLGEMDSHEQHDFFNSKYNEIWQNDPGHVIKMYFLKLKNFWWFRSGAGTEWGSWQKYLILYKIFYGAVLGLILYFLCRNLKKGIILLSFPFALSLLQAYFYVEMRHRVAIEPLLLFLAVVSFYYIYEGFNRVSKAES